MGAFQAVSTFAGWVERRLQSSEETPEVQRAFGVMEAIASSREYPLGHDLVSEFAEALRANARAVSLMGPATRRSLN